MLVTDDDMYGNNEKKLDDINFFLTASVAHA